MFLAQISLCVLLFSSVFILSNDENNINKKHDQYKLFDPKNKTIIDLIHDAIKNKKISDLTYQLLKNVTNENTNQYGLNCIDRNFVLDITGSYPRINKLHKRKYK